MSFATIIGCGDNGVSPPDAPEIDAPLPTPAVLSMTPSSNDFGSVVIGNTSAAATFTVTNTGEADSGAITPVISGANAAEFSAANGCSTLAGGGSCTITVTFAPTSSGTKAASLVVSGSPGGTVMATLLATGQTPGTLEIAPSSLAFGNVVTGVTSTSQTFTITNTGNVATGSLTVTKAGSDPVEFTKGADTCAGAPLAGGASCTVEVTFTPTSTGNKSGSFVVTGSPGGSVNGAVTGTGLAPADLSITPTFQDFGSITTGTSSGNLTFTVSNVGGVATSAVTHSFTGTDSTQFSVFNSTCNGVTLAPAATCTITVRFNPATVGAKTANLEVTATTGGTENAALVGVGVAPGNISISPTPFDFPDTTVGQTSTSQIFTVTNTGGSPSGSLGTALGGTDPSQFTIVNGSNGCQSVVLAPAATCTIAVIFAPTSGGAKAANLTVTHTGGSTAAALSGTGIAPALWTLTPASRDFGSVVTGTNSAFQDFILTNVGGQTSGVPTVAINGANASEFNFAGAPAQPCPTALAPAAACTISVRLSPVTQGAKAATLNVTGTGGPISSGLSGNGVAQAALSVNPTIITFPTTLIGNTAVTQNFTVTNDGSVNTGPLTISVVGTDLGDFTQTNNCTDGAGPGVDFLIPGASCNVVVTFAPTSRGLRSATVQVSGTPGGTVGTAVSGNALPRIEILTPAPVQFPANTFAFDDVVVDPDVTQKVTVTIRNNTAVGVDLVTQDNFTGGHFSRFGTNNCEPAGTIDLAAGATCTFQAEFHPQALGPQTGNNVVLIAGTTSPNDRATQNYTGTGTVTTLAITDIIGGQPDTTPTTPTSHDFGSRAVGSSSGVRIFRVTNTGMMTTGTLAVDLSGAGFQIAANTCSGAALTNNASCEVSVVFTPTMAAMQSATITVRTSQGAPALGGTVTATVTGTGTAPAPLVSPTSVTWTPALFAGDTNTANTDRTIAITNPNDTTTNLTFTLTDDGSNPAFTRITAGVPNSCGATLVAGATCNFRVRLTPLLPVGPRAGNLRVVQTLSGQTFDVPLMGSVRSTISLVANPTPFTNVVENTTAAQTITVRNDSPQTVTGFTVTAGGAPFFILSNTCTTLAAAGTCTFSLTFQPTTAPQSFPNTLSVSATNGSTIAAIAANSITAASVVVSPSAFDFGSEVVGQLGASQTFTFTNVGQQTSGAFTAMLTAGTNFSVTANTCAATLAENASCAVTVRFNPTAAGVQTQNLIGTGTPGGAPFAVLTGRGVAAGGVQVTPTAFTFANTTAGQQSVAFQDFVVQNTSAGSAATLNVAASANFVVVGAGTTCTGTLAAGATCTVRVRFAPATAGDHEGTLTIVTGSTYAALYGRGLTVANVVSNVGGTYANPAAISIPALGQASPFPSTINVVGVEGLVNDLTVQLFGFNHAWTADVDVLLIGPAGQRITLMSDVGFDPAGISGGSSATNLNLTFSDSAATLLPTTAFSSGTYRPTDRTQNWGSPVDSWFGAGGGNPSAPDGSATLTNTFGGTDPNGGWQLYVVDDTDPDGGTFTGGWSITLNVLEFGPQTINTTSAIRTITFSNLGETAATALTSTQSGPDGSHFQITNNCQNVVLAPVGQSGSTCTVAAAFAPTTTGTKNTQLNFAGPLTYSLLISGDAVNPAMISITPSVLQNDGSRAIGANDPAATTFTISNIVGTATTMPISFTLTNPANYAFSPANSTCLLTGGQTLTPGASCTVAVLFNPTQLGVQAGNVVVASNNTVTGLMTGTGAEALVYTGAATGAFGSVAIGSFGTTRNIVFRNDADVPTSLIQTTLANTTGSDFSIVSDTCGGLSLAAGATCTIGVRFVPSLPAGGKAGTLRIEGVVTGTMTSASVALSGTATTVAP